MVRIPKLTILSSYKFFFATIVFAGLTVLAIYFLKSQTQKVKVETPVVTSETTLLGTPTAPTWNFQIPNQKILSPFSHEYQKFNYCGPATAAMVLAFYGVKTNQFETGSYLKPSKEDRHVAISEIGDYLAQFNLKTKIRVGGDIEVLQKLIVADVPIIVQQLLRSTDDIGHYRLVRGYDNEKKVIITNDSYYGPQKHLSFSEFLTLWKPFNFKFMSVYSSEKEEVVNSILGELLADEKMYGRTKNLAELDLAKNQNDLYALLNLSESYLGLSDYKLAKVNFEKAHRLGLPKRTLWYIDWPTQIYLELGEYDKVFSIVTQVINSGNKASSEHYYQRGLVYLKLGQKEKAREEFSLALSFQPNYRLAKKALEKI